MIRQRVRLRTPALAYLVRLITVVLGAALVFYGVMAVLLAVKVSPGTVESLSAYRTAYHDLAGLTAGDFTTPVRLIAGFGGFLSFLLLMYLALQELPRPHLARGPIILRDEPMGTDIAKPRAVERLAEIAAQRNPTVTSATGRLGDDELTVTIRTSRATTAAETLSDVQQRIRTAIDEHELTDLPVNVTLTGYDPRTKRDLA